MKRKILLVSFLGLIIFLLVTTIVNFVANCNISKEGIGISEMQMINDLKKIFNKETIKGDICIVENASDEFGKIFVDKFTFKDDNGIVDKNKKVIYISCSSKMFTNILNPIEIRYLSRVFLYTANRVLPYKIAGYMLSFSSRVNIHIPGIFIFAPESNISISNKELKKLYLDNKIEKLKYEQQVDALTTAIIKEKNYRRKWSPNEDYLKGVE